MVQLESLIKASIGMCAVCGLARPIQAFYLTKRETPYKEKTSSCHVDSIRLLRRTVR